MSSPAYLPSGKSPSGRRTWKTVVLWLALIGLFAGIYVSTSERSQPERSKVSTSEPSYVAIAVAVAFVGLLVLLVRLNQRRTRAFNVANAAALKLLANADTPAALEAFEALGTKYRRSANLRVVADFNLAYALVRSGDLDRALARFIDVDREAAGINLRPSVAAQFAIIYALRGELDAARSWIAETENRLKRFVDTRALDVLLVQARALIDVRMGKYELAVRTLEERWRELENTAVGDALRPLRVLRAFALAQSGGARGSGKAEPVLAALQPTRPGEFAALGAAWPEMHAFLATNGL